MTTQAHTPWPVFIYEKPGTADLVHDEDRMKYYHIRIAGNDHEATAFLTDEMKEALERANVLSASQDEVHKWAVKHAEAICERDALLATTAKLRELLLAVVPNDCEVVCNDVNGKNCFDARDAALPTPSVTP